MDILQNTHGFSRWIIAIVAIFCIVKLLLNVMRKQNFSRSDAGLVRLYSLLLTIQFIIGAILFVNKGNEASWDFSTLRHQSEHAFSMIAALGLAHATSAFKRSPINQRSARTLLLILASLLFIVAGVARLKGMSFWWEM
jgi:hypothetical protein